MNDNLLLGFDGLGQDDGGDALALPEFIEAVMTFGLWIGRLIRTMLQYDMNHIKRVSHLRLGP